MSSNEYHTKFTNEFKKLNELINTKGDSINQIELKNKVLSLQKEIELVKHTLPSYQQLSYSEQIQSLFNSIDSKFKPTHQRRFKFSNRCRSNKVIENEPIEKKVINPIRDELPSQVPKNQVIRLNEFTSKLENLSNLIIVSNDDIDTTFLKNISNSIIFIDSKNSTFFESITNSICFVKSNQLRIHHSSNLKIISNVVLNGVVIEDSSLLTFPKDVPINDFNHPGGNSPNFVSVTYTEDQLQIIDEINNNPEEALLKLDQIFKLFGLFYTQSVR